MDRGTVEVYESRAREWIERRGEATDGLGRTMRAETGGGPVVDLGCGTGRYLSELGPPVLGLDASASMLELARRGRVPLVQGDFESLPFADATLGGLFARNSYIHLPKERFPGALAEARRVLRPGGLLMATVIEGEYEGWALPGDDFVGRLFAMWEVDELAGALEAAGLREVAVEPLPYYGIHRDLLMRARR